MVTAAVIAAVFTGLFTVLALCPPTKKAGKFFLRITARLVLLAVLSAAAGKAGFNFGFNYATGAAAAFLGLPGIAMLLITNLIFR